MIRSTDDNANADAPPARPDGATPARPVLEKMRWPLLIWPRLIWLVPLIAAVAAGVYLHRYNDQAGKEITVHFKNVNGVRTTDTVVAVHGVEIGRVMAVELAPDYSEALVRVRLHRSADNIARQNSRFFIERPDLAGGDLNGLNSIVRGPSIEVLPGDGPEASEFVGVEHQPILAGNGIRVILHGNRISKLQVSAPVYYRGIRVGTVQDIRLSSDATQVNMTVFVWDKFTKLLRPNSEFWIVSGTDVQGSVLSGIKVELGSLQTLLAGAVEFATPPDEMGTVQDGQQFPLHDEPTKEWLNWRPHIDLSEMDGPAANGNG